MIYHRFYKTPSQVLASYQIHIDEAVEHYGIRETIDSLSQYNKSCDQSSSSGLINTLADILNGIDEWKLREVLMRMNSRNVEILKEFF